MKVSERFGLCEHDLVSVIDMSSKTKARRKISLPWFRQSSFVANFPLFRQHTIDTPRGFRGQVRDAGPRQEQGKGDETGRDKETDTRQCETGRNRDVVGKLGRGRATLGRGGIGGGNEIRLGMGLLFTARRHGTVSGVERAQRLRSTRTGP